jgi:hypothetical protein
MLAEDEQLRAAFDRVNDPAVLVVTVTPLDDAVHGTLPPPTNFAPHKRPWQAKSVEEASL